MKKQICILTKSLKDHDYCVAGIEILSGNWIRLVTFKSGEAFPKEKLDDNNIKELDIVEVEIIKPVPLHAQKENYLIDETVNIKKIGEMTLNQVINLHPTDNNETIFGNTKNELDKSDIKNTNHSLELIKVSNLEFDTSLKGDGRHHYKVNFVHNKNQYNLALTDPKFRKEDYDKIHVPNATIVVSIPAIPYGENNLYYKFVAKIFI